MRDSQEALYDYNLRYRCLTFIYSSRCDSSVQCSSLRSRLFSEFITEVALCLVELRVSCNRNAGANICVAPMLVIVSFIIITDNNQR